MNPNTVDDIGEARASFAVGAKRRLEMIEDVMTFFSDGRRDFSQCRNPRYLRAHAGSYGV